MGISNFWNNFSYGFLNGMFNSNPFACGFGYTPFSFCCWSNPFVSNIFQYPSSMNYPPMFPTMPVNPFPTLSMPRIDTTSIFPTDIWNVQNNQMKSNNHPWVDSFERSIPKKEEIESNEKIEEQDSVDKKSSPASIEKESVKKSEDNKPNAQAESSSVVPGASNPANASMSGLKNEKLSDRFQGSAEQLNQLLNKKNGVLKNKGQVFIDAQNKYGINAAILAAICINESAYGTSNLARTKNNVGGVSAGMGFKSYDSVDACIMDMARFLKSGYLDKGIVTISQVGKKYCPVGDPRDKNGLNSGWGAAVTSITRKIEALA